MKWTHWKVWIYRAGLALGALIFLVQMISGFQSLQPGYLSESFGFITLVSIAGMALVVCLQIINWGILLQSLGIHLSMKELAQGYVLSSLPKYIPGSIWGYLSRGQWLRKDHGIPHGLTNLANLFEIEVTLVSAIGVILLGLALLDGSWLYLIAGLLLPAAILAITRSSVQFILRKKWLGLPDPSDQIIIHSRKLWLASLVSGVEWLILGWVVLMLVTVVSPQPLFDLAHWMLGVESFTLAWLGGFFMIFVPGGLGIRELALTGLLISNFSINHQTSALVAIASRLFYSTGEIIWLGMGLVLRVVKKGE